MRRGRGSTVREAGMPKDVIDVVEPDEAVLPAVGWRDGFLGIMT
jgi:hypothetical protein